jgi:Domain of unknown function (DUF4234)
MPGTLGKTRSPWIVIALSIVTLGIYAIYWQYAMFKEMKDYSGRGIGGVLGLVLAILLAIVNIFVMPSEVGNLYGAEGRPKPVQGITGFWILLPIIGGFIWLFKVQGHLNKFWLAHGAVTT